MGGKKAPPPAPAQAPAPAPEPEPVKPTPIPDANANAGQAQTLGGGKTLSFAEQKAAEEEEGATGIGQSANKRRPRDPATVVNNAGTGLASSAVLTG